MEKKGITLEVAAEEQIYKTINLFPLLRTTPILPAASFYLSALSPAAFLLCLSPPFSPESSSAFISLIRLSCSLAHSYSYYFFYSSTVALLLYPLLSLHLLSLCLHLDFSLFFPPSLPPIRPSIPLSLSSF